MTGTAPAWTAGRELRSGAGTGLRPQPGQDRSPGQLTGTGEYRSRACPAADPGTRPHEDPFSGRRSWRAGTARAPYVRRLPRDWHDMMHGVALFVISGVSAAGKSTVARLLAGRFERGICVPGDA